MPPPPHRMLRTSPANPEGERVSLNGRTPVRHDQVPDGVPFPDPAVGWRGHGNGPESAGLQHQAHGSLGRDQGTDGGNTRVDRTSMGFHRRFGAVGDFSSPKTSPEPSLRPIRAEIQSPIIIVPIAVLITEFSHSLRPLLLVAPPTTRSARN